MADIVKYCKYKLIRINFARLTCEQRACLIFTNLSIQKAFFKRSFGIFISEKSLRLWNVKNILNR